MSTIILFSLTLATVIISANGGPYNSYRPAHPYQNQSQYQNQHHVSYPTKSYPKAGSPNYGKSRFEEVYRWRQITYTPLDNGNLSNKLPYQMSIPYLFL